LFNIFFDLFSEEIKQRIFAGEVDWRFLLSFLMEKEGLNYGELPKGLFPFHRYADGVRSAISEHIEQSTLINAPAISFHFTIQKHFLKAIALEIEKIEIVTQKKFDVSYSEQDESSDAFVFNALKEPIKDSQGNFIRRPAGHGALLPNLQSVDSSIIFIKNIDNIQHFTKSSPSILAWSALAGLLAEIRAALKVLNDNPSFEKLVEINNQYGLYTDSELSKNESPEQFLSLINRPIRVCGMVKNEGFPGGGPFMVEKNGVIICNIKSQKDFEIYMHLANKLKKSFREYSLGNCRFCVIGISPFRLFFRTIGNFLRINKKRKISIELNHY